MPHTHASSDGVIELKESLRWRDVAAVAEGKRVILSAAALARVTAGDDRRRTIVASGDRVYGVTTGVGALSEVAVSREAQSALSHNILRSHAVGVGAPLPLSETRAIMVAAVNNFAHGRSGVRPAVVAQILDLLNAGCTPSIPRDGSVGYLTHMAHIALTLVGEGAAMSPGDDRETDGAAALARIGREPLRLEAKEGLSLVNGTPCATGMGALLLARLERWLDWADAIAALTFECLEGQDVIFRPESTTLRARPGMALVAARMAKLLEGSARIEAARGKRTQDALSLRTIPHLHGAVRDVWTNAADCVDRELESVTDNPALLDGPDGPFAMSEAHAVSPDIGLAFDQLGVAIAELGMMSERRLDRMLNPMLSGLPAFLAGASGAESGFMIAQYTASALVSANRRDGLPASLDGGVTSALQEDMLCHATAAVTKAQAILDRTALILTIELLAAAQACDLVGCVEKLAPRTRQVFGFVRSDVARYADDRPLAGDIARIKARLAETPVERVVPE